MKYSLWILEHESPYLVMAYKIRDTNSQKEIDEWMEKKLDAYGQFFQRRG